MDINCTNKCVYQTEGKCTLNSMPAMTLLNSVSQDHTCPYCMEENTL